MNGIIDFNDVQSRHGSFRDVGWRNRPAAFSQKFQGHNTSTALFALGKALKHLVSALRLLGDDELQVGAQCGLHSADVFVRHTNLICERADGAVELGQDSLGTRTKTFFGFD